MATILIDGGIFLMGVAALALLALAMDMAIRLGGEGVLMALALAAGATVPGWIALRMGGVASATLARITTGWASLLIFLLAVFSFALLIRRQREGLIVLGIATVLGAATYAIAPGIIKALSTLPVSAHPS